MIFHDISLHVVPIFSPWVHWVHVVFQVSCRGTGGDHSTSEPVDAEDDIDTSWNPRGTNEIECSIASMPKFLRSAGTET